MTSLQFNTCVIALLTVCSFLIAGARAQPTDAPLVAPEEWTFPSGLVQDNGLRGQVLLNSVWLGTWPGSETPKRVFVPAYQKSNKGITYTREFDLPAGWEKRRVMLKATAPDSDLPVTLNGEPVGTISQREWFTPLELKSVRPGRNTITIVASNLRENIELLAFPKTATIVEESFIQTSYRKKRVSIDIAGRAPAGEAVTTIVRIYSDETARDEVKAIRSIAPVTADASGLWKTTLEDNWEDPKLWSHWEPNLYWYTVELTDASGNRVDHVLPRRFGFREVWREGKHVMLNGNPLHYFSDLWTTQGNFNSISREAAAFAIANMKKMGMYSAMRNRSAYAIETFDRNGIFTSYWLGALSWPLEAFNAIEPGEAGDEGGDQELLQISGTKLEDSMRVMHGLIREYRESPSILYYTFASPWQRGTLNSSLAGRIPDPWNYWPGTNEIDKNKARYAAAAKTAAFIQSADPTRLVGTQNLPQADIETATRYLCDNLDLQEREEFWKDFEESDSTNIVWTSEHGMPFQGHQFLRDRAFQLPQGKPYPAIHIENAARLFGDDVYLQEPDTRLKEFYRLQDHDHRRSPVFQRLAAENFWNVTRVWRATPASFNAHWVLRDGFDFDSREPESATARWGAPPTADPRRSGRAEHPTLRWLPIHGVDRVMQSGDALLHALSPVLAYIGGAPSIYNKDHLFYAGESVEKTVVILNDRWQTAQISGEWLLTDPSGKVVQRGPVQTSVEPGRRSRGPVKISFTAPQVTQRTTYSLSLELTANLEGRLDDEMQITVFPQRQSSALESRLFVLANDGFDPTEAMSVLQNAKAKPILVRTPNDLRWKDGDTLVIPRKYLPVAPAPAMVAPGQEAIHVQSEDLAHPNLAFLKSVDLDAQVEKGLRVLVLEQDSSNIFGLKTETVRPRRAFVAANGHPAFDGLAQSDFSYWRGSSDLRIGAEPVADPNHFPNRIWGVSNTNAVASRTIIRPQRGAARALLVSGFDLQETPLLEVVRGKGRMIFCQLDVSNRYGTDPAATRLVDNLFSYLTTASAPASSSGDIAIISAENQVIERPETFRAQKPDGPAAWGITRAEVFFRESLYTDNSVTRKRPRGIVKVFAAAEGDLPQVIRVSSQSRMETTLSEDEFSTGWQKQKVGMVHAALRINQGSTSDVGPGIGLQRNTETLYPNRWLEGFIDPYTAACW